MLYAEYESYHFLSISLSAYVRENPMTASESSAEGEDEMLLCSPAAKCREQIKTSASVTVIPNNLMETVSQNEECQTRSTVFIPTFPPQWHLFTGNNMRLKLPGCGKSHTLLLNCNLICQRQSGGVLALALALCCDQTTAPAAPDAPLSSWHVQLP